MGLEVITSYQQCSQQQASQQQGNQYQLRVLPPTRNSFLHISLITEMRTKQHESGVCVVCLYQVKIIVALTNQTSHKTRDAMQMFRCTLCIIVILAGGELHYPVAVVFSVVTES